MPNTLVKNDKEIKKIDLDRIIESYTQAFQVRNSQDLVILLDTCSVKRIPLAEEGIPLFTYEKDYTINLTQRIFNEMQKIPELISKQTISFFYLIASGIIHPKVSNENLRLIQDTNFKAKGKEYIGIADAQMISYSIDRARKGNQTMIMSDDGHILRTVSHLRKKSQERDILYKNIFAFGIKRIVENFPEYRDNSDLNLESAAA